MTSDAGAEGNATTVSALVAEMAARLDGSTVGLEPRAATDLLAAVVGQPRSWPLLHGTAPVDAELRTRALTAAGRFARGMPFAYAVGRAAFRHLELDVDWRVLIPRPETELLVDLVLQAPQAAPGSSVADIGTGSGAIALALASEGAFARVLATDISLDALSVARANADALHDRLRVPVEFRAGDSLHPLAGERLDVVVSNPPYIAFSEVPLLPDLVRDWEPPQALSCADEGLAVIRRLVEDGGRVLRYGGLLALEVDARRAREVQQMFARHGGWSDVAVHLDLTGRERFVTATCTMDA